MNPRILKKLSKKADPYVRQLTKIDRFEVDSEEPSIDSSQRVERKHFERWGGKPNRYGYFIALEKTVGYGGMAGYYEPEWEEDDAYSILQRMVADHFTDWESFDWDGGNHPKPSVNVRNPRNVFLGAAELLKAERQV